MFGRKDIKRTQNIKVIFTFLDHQNTQRYNKITQPFFKKKNQSSKLNNVKSISLNEKKSLVSTIYF